MRGNIDENKVSSGWEARGFSFGIWTDPPGQMWEGYVHEVDELFMVRDGKVELELHGKKFFPEPGKEILIPAKAVHSVRNLGPTISHWFYGYKELISK